jgi:hypothetical protein
LRLAKVGIIGILSKDNSIGDRQIYRSPLTYTSIKS